ncbi:MAG: LysR substrate-binding domain-containing protein [Acidovorax sp.]
MEKPLPALDLTALDIFRTVAAEGSVTRAAERLSRAQSNVTTRVRQLEAELGATLFLREGKRMALTPEGEVLLGYADRLLALAEEARQALRPGRPGGRLRLGAMESTAASRLPAPLARLHAQWPGVALELSTGTSQALVDRLRAHALDAALVAWPPGQAVDAALDARPVFTEALMLALPAGHPRVREPQDVRPGTLAVFGAGCTYRRIAQDWFAPRPQPMQLLELASYHAILACVAGGGCVGVVPQSVLTLASNGAPLTLHPLAAIDTLLVRRHGYRSAALDALEQALAPPA